MEPANCEFDGLALMPPKSTRAPAFRTTARTTKAVTNTRRQHAQFNPEKSVPGILLSPQCGTNAHNALIVNLIPLKNPWLYL